MTEITEGLKDKVVIDILRKNTERLRRENKAHLQVAINIQDTLTKSTAQYKAEITKLKELMLRAVPIVSKVSGIEAHTLWKELREAAK